MRRRNRQGGRRPPPRPRQRRREKKRPGQAGAAALALIPSRQAVRRLSRLTNRAAAKRVDRWPRISHWRRCAGPPCCSSRLGAKATPPPSHRACWEGTGVAGPPRCSLPSVTWEMRRRGERPRSRLRPPPSRLPTVALPDHDHQQAVSRRHALDRRVSAAEWTPLPAANAPRSRPPAVRVAKPPRPRHARTQWLAYFVSGTWACSTSAPHLCSLEDSRPLPWAHKILTAEVILEMSPGGVRAPRLCQIQVRMSSQSIGLWLIRKL